MRCVGVKSCPSNGDLAVKDECENPFSVSFFYMFGQTFPFVMVGLSLAINRMADYV
jgi:hypothetical protein